jgi:hypothetical protein
VTLGEKLSKLRKAVFPIEGHEMKKFLMMSGMMFFIIYVYTVVRDTKDTLIVSHCGAEAITFLKVRTGCSMKGLEDRSIQVHTQGMVGRHLGDWGSSFPLSRGAEYIRSMTLPHALSLSRGMV